MLCWTGTNNYFTSFQCGVNFLIYLLLILQSFDWLAAFHLELLQAILFIDVVYVGLLCGFAVGNTRKRS